MRYLLMVCATLLLIRPALADTPAASLPPPEPEQFLNDGHYSEYAKAAMNYLRDQPDAPAAPRVASDLLLTATVYDDQTSASRMRKLIVSAYPESVQAKYLIGSLPDAAQFAQLMAEVGSDNLDSIPTTFPRNFDQAQRLGVARFGGAALGSGAELVQGFLLAQMAGDAQIANAEIQLLNKSGPAGEVWRQIVTIVADNSTPPMTRLQHLHALPERAAAVPFEQYLLSQLPDAQRQSPNATLIQADDLLNAGRMSDALPLLQKLSAAATPDTRILFWQAWATAAAGNPGDADKLLRDLIQKHPRDAWAAEAAELEPAVSALDANVVSNVEAALSASRRLQRGVGALEGHATFQRPDGERLGIYLGIDSPDMMELAFQRGSETAMMYHATDQEASLFFQGLSQTIRYSKPILFPAPRLTLSRIGANFHFGGDLRFVSNFDELQSALTDLLASHFASTRDGLEDLLHDFTSHGIFPLAAQPAAGGATTYTWVNPAVADPTAQRVSFTIASDGTIAAMQSGAFQITDLHYGPAGSLKITPPPLPANPSLDRGPMSAAVLQNVLPAVYQLLYPPPPSPPTTKP